MREVCDAGQEVSVPERWSLIWESTTPDKAYLVIEGTLEVVAHGKRIAELHRGDLVGEIGIRDHRLRTGTVTALTPLVMLHFTSEVFSDLYARIAPFREAVDATVEARTGDAGAVPRAE